MNEGEKTVKNLRSQIILSLVMIIISCISIIAINNGYVVSDITRIIYNIVALIIIILSVIQSHDNIIGSILFGIFWPIAITALIVTGISYKIYPQPQKMKGN